jgi:hypothetical protein
MTDVDAPLHGGAYGPPASQAGGAPGSTLSTTDQLSIPALIVYVPLEFRRKKPNVIGDPEDEKSG